MCLEKQLNGDLRNLLWGETCVIPTIQCEIKILQLRDLLFTPLINYLKVEIDMSRE